MHQQSPEMQSCIDACQACHITCLQMAATHCLEMGGAHAEPQHIRLMLDCAQICATAADFMARGSAHHAAICKACAEICRACAESCDRLDGMEECADICRRCAESCEAMASQLA
ncbi:MAG: ferredoxin [Sphingopyxis sp.]|nr:ferredoxin [Sphingopyxis sp.]